MEEQGKGGEILFPAALRDGLAGPVSEAVAKGLLVGTRWLGAAWLGLVRACRLYRIHGIFSREGTLIERSTAAGGELQGEQMGVVGS